MRVSFVTDDETKLRRAAREAPTKWTAAIASALEFDDQEPAAAGDVRPRSSEERRRAWSDYDETHGTPREGP